VTNGLPRADVVATVGTDHHRFDRLVGWVDAWAAAHPDVVVLVQHGTATPPRHARGVVMLGYDDLVAAMASAAVVVAQGGPATIMDARSVGHRPVVVPRRAHLQEVVDDHQVTFARWMAGRDLIWMADDERQLHLLLDQSLADPPRVRIPAESGAAPTTIEAFRREVDPLLVGWAERRVRRAGKRR